MKIRVGESSDWLRQTEVFPKTDWWLNKVLSCESKAGGELWAQRKKKTTKHWILNIVQWWYEQKCAIIKKKDMYINIGTIYSFILVLKFGLYKDQFCFINIWKHFKLTSFNSLLDYFKMSFIDVSNNSIVKWIFAINCTR